MIAIVERLRRWTHDVNAVPASDLMDEAASEIERLRLTDSEQEAIRIVAAVFPSEKYAATLRNLLVRHGTKETT